ncbi:hypothetical protein BAY61_32075 (plasmid) [Prauserella marina]|nr:hypothetical protein BAY61_32075 [Prauserella marina]
MVPRAEADLVLREQLATDPDYDVEANLDTNTRRKWNAERDETLIQGWDERRPLAELVTELFASEIDIAGRCIRLGLAEDSLAVVERLGCASGGALDLRCRMMRDRAAASVWVLVVDGLPEGRHVSLHTTRNDARAHLTTLTSAETPAGTITATVAQRAIGSPHGPVDTVDPETQPQHQPRST